MLFHVDILEGTTSINLTNSCCYQRGSTNSVLKLYCLLWCSIYVSVQNDRYCAKLCSATRFEPSDGNAQKCMPYAFIWLHTTQNVSHYISTQYNFVFNLQKFCCYMQQRHKECCWFMFVKFIVRNDSAEFVRTV